MENEIKTQPILEYDINQLIETLNAGFADYLVPIQFTHASIGHFLIRDGVDLSSSRFLVSGDDVAGAALVARRGWNTRLAGMALLPEFRGKGLGKWFLNSLIEEARDRGERTMELEVITKNEPAVHLYRESGFTTIRELISLQGVSTRPYQPGNFREVDPLILAKLVSTYGLPDLPWQISGETLAHVTLPSRTFQLEQAYLSITNPEMDRINILSIFTHPEVRGKKQASRLLGAVLSAYPGKTWGVPALCPEELAGIFENAGFSRGGISQYQMRKNLKGD